MRKLHRYTPEQIDYIRKVSKGNTREQIKDLFNAEHDTSITLASIRSVMSRYGIKNRMQGHSTRFSKGQPAWNKGTKGVMTGGVETQFKKGDKHLGSLPIGSESYTEGRVRIKVAEPNVWKEKHLHIWRERYGEVPEGHVLRFKDGDSMNVTLDNLFCVERSVMTSVVRRGLDYNDPDLKLAIHNVARVELTTKRMIDNET